MRKLIILTICLIAINAESQTPLVLADSAYYFTQEGHASLITFDFTAPRDFTFTRNSVRCVNSSGHVLQCGTDDPSDNDHHLDNAVISGNFFHFDALKESGAHGIMAGHNINYHIVHNYIDSMGYAVIIEGSSGMSYDAGGVYYNIFRESQYYALIISGQSDVPVFNNTFYNNEPANIGLPVIIVKENNQVEGIDEADRVIVKNNIFYSKHNTMMIQVGDTCISTFECDYNLYWIEDGDHHPTFYINGTGELSWSEWQALGFDTHSIVMDPNFRDTVRFVPGQRLEYGTDLGADYNSGLASSYKFNVGEYPDTSIQHGVWQVGAVIYSFGLGYNIPILDTDSKMQVYPNPAGDFITIQIDETVVNPNYINILDTSGSLLDTFRIRSHLNIYQLPENLNNGLYIVQMVADDNLITSTQKLLISR